MSPLALKRKTEGQWDFQKQRNLPLHPPWVHGEADILKMVPWLQQSSCLGTGPPFHKCHCISQEWHDKQTCCQEAIYKCSLLCINATLTWTKPPPSQVSQPLKWETRHGAYSALGRIHTLHPGLPHRHLQPACRPLQRACWVLFYAAGRFDHAKSYLPGKMLSSYARGHSQRLSMWARGKHNLEATISQQ